MQTIKEELDLFFWFIRRGFRICDDSFGEWQWLISGRIKGSEAQYQRELFWTNLNRSGVAYNLNKRVHPPRKTR